MTVLLEEERDPVPATAHAHGPTLAKPTALEAHRGWLRPRCDWPVFGQAAVELRASGC